jgi:hypothetical protein
MGGAGSTCTILILPGLREMTESRRTATLLVSGVENRMPILGEHDRSDPTANAW